MIHSVSQLLEHLHKWYDLTPGDLIWTGTPKGVGPMKAGDLVEARMTNSDGQTVSVLNAVCV
jgi:2-keto-4-pentenoate hydratase/2-oxohepta-3-ene-1,7-dioic acid hydratase in catechol pathway